MRNFAQMQKNKSKNRATNFTEACKIGKFKKLKLKLTFGKKKTHTHTHAGSVYRVCTRFLFFQFCDIEKKIAPQKMNKFSRKNIISLSLSLSLLCVCV
jgi:hypothetical protein